jgi:transposase-like protein
MSSRKKGVKGGRLVIVGILIIISIILPIVLILSYLTSAKRGREQRVNKENLVIRNEVVDSDQLSPHFIIDQEFISSHSCFTERLSSSKGIDVTENNRMILNNDKLAIDSHWQLCIAHHNHQHSFKLEVFPDHEPQRDLKTTCDLYLSTSAISPTFDNWDWKTTNDITIHSYATEFQKSALDALFISLHGVGCSLELEVTTVPMEELLHKINLRGGQRLLPRDLDRLMKNSS